MAGHKQTSIKTLRSSSFSAYVSLCRCRVQWGLNVVCISMLHKAKDVQPICKLPMLTLTMSSLDTTSNDISTSKSRKQKAYDVAYVAAALTSA